MHAYRTHTCAQLSAENVGETVRLVGLGPPQTRFWRRFVRRSARSFWHYPDCSRRGFACALEVLDRLRAESVVTIDGEVKARSADTVNPKLATGEVEVFAARSRCRALPKSCLCQWQTSSNTPSTSASNTASSICGVRRCIATSCCALRLSPRCASRMTEQGFTEFQTPILTASPAQKARATFSCRAGCTPTISTRFPRRRRCSSRC